GAAEEEERRHDDDGHDRGRRDALRAEAGQQERERENRDNDDDRERGHGAERVDEVGSREPEAVSQRVLEAPPFDKDARNGEAEEREPGKRDEVDAREDEHPGGRDRQE